jgi:hypothetical protein
MYKTGANAILALHVLWTAILFCGAVFVIFAPWYAVYQIIAISFTLLISLPLGGVCPLTLVEERLRKKVDPSFTNDGSYLVTYLNKIFGAKFKKKSILKIVAILYIASIGISIATLIYK